MPTDDVVKGAAALLTPSNVCCTRPHQARVKLWAEDVHSALEKEADEEEEGHKDVGEKRPEKAEEDAPEGGPPVKEEEDPKPPENVGGRTYWKGCSITKKKDHWKVHIPRSQSNNGKECDVQLVFKGGDAEASFKNTLAYIRRRTEPQKGTDVD